jgi:hypothetical protein
MVGAVPMMVRDGRVSVCIQPLSDHDVRGQPGAANLNPSIYAAGLKGGQGRLKGPSDLREHHDGDIPFAALDLGNVGAIQVRLEGKLLLRQTAALRTRLTVTTRSVPFPLIN